MEAGLIQENAFKTATFLTFSLVCKEIHYLMSLLNSFLIREEWMRAIQSVANSLKMREEEEEEPMEVFGSPTECSFVDMEVAMSKSRNKVVGSVLS